ncbi:MAG: diguanylate cyclase [Lachnospiraceae bacterium]|nr:diguanylate cyclase [Lachnospiraceae bacterium]
MGTKKKNGQNMLQWIIPTAILVIVILFTLTSYRNDILTKEEKSNLDEYSNKTREIADYYSSELYMISQVARMLSTRLSYEHDYFCDENVNILTSVVTQLNIDAGYILRNDGKVMNNKGVEAPNLKSATEGDLDIENGSVDEYIVNASGDCVHYISASFAEGSVILKYTPKKISELETFLSSSSKTLTYLLVSSTGVILDSAGDKEVQFKYGDNLFDYLQGADYNGANKKDEFYKNLEQNNKGRALITTAQNETKHIIYQPIGDYKTFVMIIIDDDQIVELAKNDSSSTTQLFWKVVILMLVFVGILIVISIINATNYHKANRELREQAETDLLTDLYNKVATETKIREYLANEGKNKKAIMFVLDIDNFKKINDTMGHAFGDEVLSTLGHQLKSEFRINDIIGRTGGDEFIILLKDLKDDAALKREAARVATFFKNFKVGEYTKYSATASIGAVEIPSDGTDFDALYKAADKALYLAKKRGKNQMAFYKDTKDVRIEMEKPVLKADNADSVKPGSEALAAPTAAKPVSESEAVYEDPNDELIEVFEDNDLFEETADFINEEPEADMGEEKKVVKKVVKRVVRKQEVPNEAVQNVPAPAPVPEPAPVPAPAASPRVIVKKQAVQKSTVASPKQEKAGSAAPRRARNIIEEIREEDRAAEEALKKKQQAEAATISEAAAPAQKKVVKKVVKKVLKKEAEAPKELKEEVKKEEPHLEMQRDTPTLSYFL